MNYKKVFSSKNEAVAYVGMPHTQKCGWGNKTRGNLQIGESAHFAPNRNSPILQNWQQSDKRKIEMQLKTDWEVSVVSDWVFLLLSLHHITDTIKPCLKEPPHIHKTRQDQVARVARAWQELEGLGRMIACRWSPRVDDHLRAVVMPNINTETQIQIQIQGKSGSQWDDHRSGWSLVGGGDATQGTPGSRWAKRIGAGQAR